MKSELIHARVNPKLKDDVENILSQIGLTTSEAIRIYFNYIVSHNGIPFELKVPNETTKRAMYEAENNIDIEKFDTIEDAFSKLTKIEEESKQ